MAFFQIRYEIKFNRLSMLIFFLPLCILLSSITKAEEKKPEAKPEAKPETKIEIRYKGRRLSLAVENAEVKDVIKEIAKAVRAEFEIKEGIGGKVDKIKFDSLSLEDGLERLIGGKGFGVVIEYKEKAPIKITVMKKEEKEYEEGLRRLAERESAFKKAFESLDKRKHKIARALEEFLAPGTSRERKGEIMDYLRGASIDDPEDKRILKEALSDRRYEEIKNSMQMALLHAIQDHPDETDKEFILKLLKEKDVGWVSYAMPVVWDRRYIPYLIDFAKAERPSSTAIKILGRCKVKEAVPCLEEALKNKDPDVRLDAYYALLNITGKKYQYEDNVKGIVKIPVKVPDRLRRKGVAK